MTTVLKDKHGVSTVTLCREVGCSYRQIDYWTRQGFISPSVRQGRGSGTARRWSTADVNMAKVLYRFSDASYTFRHRIANELQSIKNDLNDGWLIIGEDGSVTVTPAPEYIPELIKVSGSICHVLPLGEEAAA